MTTAADLTPGGAGDGEHRTDHQHDDAEDDHINLHERRLPRRQGGHVLPRCELSQTTRVLAAVGLDPASSISLGQRPSTPASGRLRRQECGGHGVGEETAVATHGPAAAQDE